MRTGRFHWNTVVVVPKVQCVELLRWDARGKYSDRAVLDFSHGKFGSHAVNAGVMRQTVIVILCIATLVVIPWADTDQFVQIALTAKRSRGE